MPAGGARLPAPRKPRRLGVLAAAYSAPATLCRRAGRGFLAPAMERRREGPLGQARSQCTSPTAAPAAAAACSAQAIERGRGATWDSVLAVAADAANTAAWRRRGHIAHGTPCSPPLPPPRTPLLGGGRAAAPPPQPPPQQLCCGGAIRGRRTPCSQPAAEQRLGSMGFSEHVGAGGPA